MPPLSKEEPPADSGLNNVVFPQAEIFITIGAPVFNAITTQTPTFAWVMTKKELVIVSVFDNPISITNNRITNYEDIVWVWHSGFIDGREGNVQFANGSDVIDGVIQYSSPTTPLIIGNSYYWAIWAWDEFGRYITHSSAEFFFTVN